MKSGCHEQHKPIKQNKLKLDDIKMNTHMYVFVLLNTAYLDV